MTDGKVLGKQAACRKAVEVVLQLISDFDQTDKNRPLVLGIGSGSTVAEFVPHLKQALILHDIRLPIICVPTSSQAEMLILQHDLSLGSLNANPEVDIIIDGADEVCRVDGMTHMIKGGGGAMTSEKLVSLAAKKRIYMVDESKVSRSGLGQSGFPVPVEVLPSCHVWVVNQLKSVLPESEFESVSVRIALSGKAGPVITDHGNIIIDVKPKANFDVLAWESILSRTEGVVGHGLFVLHTDYVIVGDFSGKAFFLE